jgi:3-isopropylmalate/(R)-2-methylmalate dehydratase large subunit
MNKKINFNNKILYLTKNEKLFNNQLNKSVDIDLNKDNIELIDNISTDEITPGWVCFRYDKSLGDYSLIGLRNTLIKKGTLLNGEFEVLVSGKSKGCGSSREHAPYSEKYAGVKLVIAKSFEKIYHQNCQNIGLLTSSDFSIINRIKAGESIDISEFTKNLSPINKAIVEAGGLFKYNSLRLNNKIEIPVINRKKSPMTLVEKIILKNAYNIKKEKNSSAIKSSDTILCKVNIRFSHDYVTAMLADLFYSNFGKDALVKESNSIFAFRDHLTFVNDVLSKKKKEMIPLADNLAIKQKEFIIEQNIKLYDEVKNNGSKAICHNAIIEDIAIPGDIIIGTDSHTCTAGALGTFAFGVGSTDMANAFYTNDIFVTVPESISIELKDELKFGISAKDLVFHIMNYDYFKTDKIIGKVIEYTGDGLLSLSVDERATLTNMAVEMGAMTAIVAIDQITIDFIKTNRQKKLSKLDILQADEEATYAYKQTINLCEVETMVSLPGDPKNVIKINHLQKNKNNDIAIDIAYGGSCTGGKNSDMDMYAEVVNFCIKNDIKINPNVKCYVQFGSLAVKKYAENKDYISIFEKFGVELIPPSCGACINAGPGVSTNKSQISISAINRNFPGRSGPGKVYLASPYTVMSSAVLGYVADFNQLINKES